MVKRVLLAVGAVVLVLVVAVVALFAVTFMGRRAVTDGEELGRARIVADGFTSTAVVSIGANEVLLVDAGQDAEGVAILTELKRRGLGPEAVRAVLITHGHQDHIGAVGRFPKADVMALEADVPLVEGRSGSRGPLTRLFPVSPTGIAVSRVLRDGETIAVGEVRVRVFALPGHTAGSAAYLVDDVLFVGDSADVSGDGGIVGSPWIFSDSQADNRASLARLAQQLDREAVLVRAVVPAHSGSVQGRGPLTAFAQAEAR